MSKGGKWSERRERVWKEGRGVKWAGISQALRTRDRDVSRERDKKPLSRAGSVGCSVAHDLSFPRWCRGVSTRGSSTRADRMDFIVARNCGHRSKSPSIIPHNRPIRQAPLWIASQWFCPRSFCRTSPHYFNPKETDLYEISKRDEIKVGYYRSTDARRGTCSTICRDKVWR